MNNKEIAKQIEKLELKLTETQSQIKNLKLKISEAEKPKWEPKGGGFFISSGGGGCFVRINRSVSFLWSGIRNPRSYRKSLRSLSFLPQSLQTRGGT